jgi:hypothetical protein
MEIAFNDLTVRNAVPGVACGSNYEEARQMKIQGNHDLLGRVRMEPPASAPAAAPGGFGEVLKNSLSEASGPAAAAAPGGALRVQFNSVDPTPADSVAARLESFLTLMDAYRSKLADSRVSLKGLDPLVRSLEQGRDALVPLANSLPESDGLKDILNRTLVTTEVEIMRFRRGDYLPA